MPAENSNKPLRILLVEDSPSDAALLEANILAQGATGDFSVSATGSLQQALVHLKNNRFDAVLLDLNLPDSTGLSTIQQARQTSPDAPIIVLTGLDDEKMGMEAVHAGVQDYLVKGQADGRTIIRAVRYAIQRKKIEAALRESKQRLKFHIQNSPLAVVEWDADYVVTMWSSEAERIFGWSAAETAGKRIDTLKMIYEEDIPIVNKTMERLSSGKEHTVVSSNRNYTKSGAVIECVWYNSVLLDDKGKMTSTMSLVQDVTAQKLAKEERERLLAELAFQARLLSEVQDAVFSSDGNYTITFWNKAAENMFGWTKKEVLGKNSGELLKPKVEGSSRDRERSNLRSVGFWKGEVQYIRKDRTYFFADINSTVLKDANGKDIGNVVVARDITERIKADKELREKEFWFRSIFENSNDSIVLIDAVSGRYIDCNHTLERLSGYTREEILAMKAGGIFTPPRKDQAASNMEAIKATGKLRGETEIVTRDGRLIPAEYNTSLQTIGDRQFLLSVVRDMTDRKRAEEELSKYANDLAIANKELESFSYSISHDLRAPLRAMKGFSSIMVEDYSGKLDAEGREFLQRINAGADKMGDLINDMLSLAKISRQEMSLQEINLSGLADSVANELRLAEPERKVDITIAPTQKVTGDARLMHIALTNLIGNAWKYTSKTPAARIEFGTSEQDGETVYHVRDNGAGFDMTQVHRIFAPFQRLHTESQFPGTGIGLAIVNMIIQRHGGWIRAEGETGRGATFYFTLSLNKGATAGGRK